MLERFEGKDGKRRLAEVFAEQALVQHNDTVARKLAEAAKIEDVQKGKQLYVQGEPGKNSLFFVLGGSLELSVEGKRVAILEPGQAVGEFPIVDPSLNYAVTVFAREQSVVARVSEEQFLSIARDHPEIWRSMAKMLVTRLRKTDESRQGPGGAEVVKPGALTIGDLIRGLTVDQLWKIIVAIVGALAAVATVAYKIGTDVW